MLFQQRSRQISVTNWEPLRDQFWFNVRQFGLRWQLACFMGMTEAGWCGKYNHSWQVRVRAGISAPNVLKTAILQRSWNDREGLAKLLFYWKPLSNWTTRLAMWQVSYLSKINLDNEGKLNRFIDIEPPCSHGVLCYRHKSLTSWG